MRNINFILNPFLFLYRASSKKLLSFHLSLAILGLFSNIFIIVWFYFLILSFVRLNKRQKHIALPMFLAYLVPLEVYSRMLICDPFVPVEGIKYLAIILLFYAIASNFNKSNKIGWLLIFLSIPSFFIIPFEYYSIRFYLISSYLGFFVMVLFIIYFSKLSFTQIFLINLLKIILFGSLLVLFHVIFSSSFETFDFKLLASSKFTAGFGSNQVSSILGVGLIILIIDLMFGLNIFSSRTITYTLIILFILMILLSFSRGGIISPVIAILICIFKFSRNINYRFLKRFAFGLTLFFSVFFLVNSLTYNKLYSRFSGETEATILGSKEKNLNTITSGRFKLFSNDLQIFFDNPIFGVGPGQSIPSRLDYDFDRTIVPHVQLSTLVAEHGVFGLIMAIIIIVHFLSFLRRRVNNLFRFLLLFSICLAITYTFHSATRTIIPAFFYAVSFVNFKHQLQNSKK